MSVLFDFLAGKKRDSRGRHIDDILAFDDAMLESSHDYIQWLFPLRDASAFNRGAPVLTGSDVALMRMTPEIRTNLGRALERMLSFYGFPAVEDLRWLRRHDHNFLRITRILKSLKLAGMDVEAQRFYDWLVLLHARSPTVIGEETFGFWTAAVQGDAARDKP